MVSLQQKRKKKNKNKHKEYYAVYEGRVDQPTIFSSWGDAHPRVTGCKADFEGCVTIEEAREFMKERGVTEPKEVFKEGAGETAPLPNKLAFYAVAHGESPGIYPCYYGKRGAKKEVNEFSGACHKHFRTCAQAEAFIEDWKDSYADIWRSAIREALDQGLRPVDMEFEARAILRLPERDDIMEELEMDKLSTV